MAKSSLPKEQATRLLMMHAALREVEERFKHELLDADERELLRDRVIRLKTKLAATS